MVWCFRQFGHSIQAEKMFWWWACQLNRQPEWAHLLPDLPVWLWPLVIALYVVWAAIRHLKTHLCGCACVCVRVNPWEHRSLSWGKTDAPGEGRKDLACKRGASQIWHEWGGFCGENLTSASLLLLLGNTGFASAMQDTAGHTYNEFCTALWGSWALCWVPLYVPLVPHGAAECCPGRQHSRGALRSSGAGQWKGGLIHHLFPAFVMPESPCCENMKKPGPRWPQGSKLETQRHSNKTK